MVTVQITIKGMQGGNNKSFMINKVFLFKVISTKDQTNYIYIYIYIILKFSI